MPACDIYIRLGVFVFLFAVFIIFTKKITEGIARSFISAFNIKKLLEIDRELLLKTNRNYALVFLLPMGAFLLSYKTINPSSIECCSPSLLFLIICLGSAAYLLLKAGALSLLDYVNQTTCFKAINRFFRNYLIISLTTIIIGNLFSFLIPIIKNNVLIIWVIVCCVVPYFIYLCMASKIIFENKFSLFFYILYICALEILPLAVVLKIILIFFS